MKTERKNNSDKGKYVIGIEIDKFFVKAMLVDIQLKPLERMRFSAENVKSIGSKCADLVEELIKKTGVQLDDVKRIGVAAGKRPETAAKKIEKILKIKTFFEDPALSAALGEIHLNPEAGSAENILYVYSDLGGCAVLKNRKPEVLPEEVSGYLRPWDASLDIAAIAKREVERGVGTKIVAVSEGHIDRIDDTAVLEAARQNDEVAINIIHSVGVTLGIRIAYLVNLVNLGTVILGGNLEKGGKLLAEPIKNIVKKLALKSKTESLNIIQGKAGEDAACLGSASLAIQGIYRNG